MRRFFYTPEANSVNQNSFKTLADYNEGDSFHLTDTVYHHWCRVLRAKVGDNACLFDGFGGSYEVILTDITKKHAIVERTTYCDADNTPNMITQIGLVMSRGDRMDYAIQKATEMGVVSIQLLTSERGELRLKPAQIAKKLNHWQQVAISACEQCGLNRVPIIFAPIAIHRWIEALTHTKSNTLSPRLTVSVDDNSDSNSDDKRVCNYMLPLLSNALYQVLTKPADISLVLSVPKPQVHNATTNIYQVFQEQHQQSAIEATPPFIRLLVGAEGGLTAEEEEQALITGWQAWQIGGRVLRTETAPVVALASLQMLQAMSDMYQE